MCVLDDSKWGILHENKGLGETFVKISQYVKHLGDMQMLEIIYLFIFYIFIYVNI